MLIQLSKEGHLYSCWRGPITDHWGSPRVGSEQLLRYNLTFVICQRLLK